MKIQLQVFPIYAVFGHHNTHQNELLVRDASMLSEMIDARMSLYSIRSAFPLVRHYVTNIYSKLNTLGMIAGVILTLMHEIALLTKDAFGINRFSDMICRIVGYK